MTAIEYGGGPTVQQRKDFCNLRPGSHIPGYMGYCPQFKFNHGDTFSRQTSKIAQKLAYYNGPNTPYKVLINPRIGDGKISATPKVFKDEVPRDRIPLSTGDNKLIENMIPGYSGMVPRMISKFGGTYKHLCDTCVDEFVSDYNNYHEKSEKLREQTSLFPKVKPIRDDPGVRDHMNLWIDEYMDARGFRIGSRGPTEPPMPGYQGFIPKANTTNLSLGKTFHVGSENCLEAFRMEIKDHFDKLKLPVEPLKKKPEKLGPSPIGLNDYPHSWRIFQNTGVIPQYAGHVHGEQFASGRTVGDTSRNLEVCKHQYPSYGMYLRNRDLVRPCKEKE